MPGFSPLLLRVAPENRDQLMKPVSAAHLTALTQMHTAGLARPVLDEATKAELTRLGYAREMLGGFGLTPIGQVRAMMEQEGQ